MTFIYVLAALVASWLISAALYFGWYEGLWIDSPLLILELTAVWWLLVGIIVAPFWLLGRGLERIVDWWDFREVERDLQRNRAERHRESDSGS